MEHPGVERKGAPHIAALRPPWYTNRRARGSPWARLQRQELQAEFNLELLEEDLPLEAP